MFLKVGANKQMYFFSSFVEFQAYDPGHSGFIALNNPDFGQYYLGRYVADTRTIMYQSLQNSGVAGITLSYNNLGEAVSAAAIMTDSSRRNIDMVPINDSFLLLATLKPSKEMTSGS